jgi:hypothetical protein
VLSKAFVLFLIQIGILVRSPIGRSEVLWVIVYGCQPKFESVMG